MEIGFVYLLSFGSNLGDREANFRRGFLDLKSYTKLLRQTRWIKTEPLPSEFYDTANHEDYLNAVCEVSTSFCPQELYERIKKIEDEIGHSRDKKWMPRHLDIDILFCGIGKDIENAVPYFYRDSINELTVPHQSFWEREFLVDFLEELKIDKNKFMKSFSQISF